VRLLGSTLVFCVLIAVGPAAASAPSPIDRARLDGTIHYLQEAQNPDGGFGGTSGRESGQGFSAWVALALAAAGINPRCQAKPGGADAYGFLAAHFRRGLEEEIPYPSIPTTAFERELMVVDASGTDPHSFAGYDLVEEVLARALPDGSFPYVPGGRGEINDTIFAIVALAPVREPEAQAAIQRAADWLIAQQDDDGGWSFEVRGRRTEADMTGAAIQALRAAGRADTDAERDGLRYLRAMQGSDGGFPEFPGEGESNVASTAWAVQGIWSAGQDPEAWARDESDPLSYMASLQQPDGHIRWKASEDSNGVWMTAYVAPAFAGQAWPIPPSPCSAKPQAAAGQPGQGEGSQSGSGVIAGGGGGGGAPLFSRPKPQSKGRTPGGTRQVRRNRYAIDHSETRRGENAGQAAITATSEARREHDGAPAGARESGGGEGGAGSSSTGGDRRQGGGREVSGMLVGGGAPGFGAPGLHGAGTSGDGPSESAIAIGAVALLFCLGGFQLERSRGVVLP
jgi:prenyltransferase beta subunit